jgi:hypothetical protein
VDLQTVSASAVAILLQRQLLARVSSDLFCIVSMLDAKMVLLLGERTAWYECKHYAVTRRVEVT